MIYCPLFGRQEEEYESKELEVNSKSFQSVHIGAYNWKDVTINYFRIGLNQSYEDLLCFISHLGKRKGFI